MLVAVSLSAPRRRLSVAVSPSPSSPTPLHSTQSPPTSPVAVSPLRTRSLLFQATKVHLVRDKHIAAYANQRIGIDASAWLHRGCVMYSFEIITRTEPWRKKRAPPPWIDYPLRMVSLLSSSGITPVVVFDGVSSPAKAPTSSKRRERKQAAKARGMELIRQGNDAAARKVLMGAFEVTPEMSVDLIVELKRRNIEFVVAPYEADAQLAYMASTGRIDGIITEDSDLFAYGCERPILFKLCPAGTVQELTLARLLRDPGDFEGWTVDELRSLCVLSGCDFLPSIKGMGFKTALKVIKNHGTRAGVETLARTLAQLQAMDRWKACCTREYCTGALRAMEAFRYSLVYDVERRQCVYMNADDAAFQELCAQKRDLTHLGPRIVRDEEGVLEQICRGQVCGRTFMEIDHGAATPFSAAKRKEPVKKGGIFNFLYKEGKEDKEDKEDKEGKEGKEGKDGKENRAQEGRGWPSPLQLVKKRREGTTSSSRGSIKHFINFWKPSQ